MKQQLPHISIVIPTLNSASVLEKCLRSISIQKYPKSKVEIIIADGASLATRWTSPPNSSASTAKTPNDLSLLA
ncbi:MAG: Glycosyltransferase AglE [Candidatus Collierbacteria bacterium GW2011_GWB1_45_35]|uniref:Glycosyltransferase AglE n=2 Tax=Candidatus Collieribacteriota TaxID=1752725 RepID=A0A0G1KSE7_9BACT|nr:MAG: Glycosyltransferase AglE [Microgenomates group bacterium GW2011_GWC1_44_23]KKT86546.1 MAG: Glycosyltransferase AglE [Candidatus Collierbacteria bacterium GW2011_GWA2_44_99]KKT95847.1 MAG: Glycosyltransferase AglE [Candidatus Collierbacteria bacterium GW2011_GWA1_45_15]KKU00209.1 MAG: Glycosyltransferase AglE [Candidatus Collierbacteria bacterium GW2011_GWB2_45_17]KKU05237.1 MAG: Glycosyltransferase AglE [Candidatus Collierbacteria bacterium GW2011_GWB1_45_35]KKU07091.1 MAG: Glycosyltra